MSLKLWELLSIWGNTRCLGEVQDLLQQIDLSGPKGLGSPGDRQFLPWGPEPQAYLYLWPGQQCEFWLNGTLGKAIKRRKSPNCPVSKPKARRFFSPEPQTLWDPKS